MMIKPINFYVIVEPESDDKDFEKSGLAVPKDYKKESCFGEVVAVHKNASELKVKNKILFNKFKATSFKIKDKEYFYLDEEDVVGVF